MNVQPPDYSFKVLLVGESGVGKSSLLIRFTEQQFSEAYTCTIGLFFILIITIIFHIYISNLNLNSNSIFNTIKQELISN